MLRRPVVLSVLAVIGAAVIVALLRLFGFQPLPGDLAITRGVQDLVAFESAVGRGFARSDLLVWIAAALAVILLALRQRFESAVLLALGAVSSYVLGDLLIKPLVARPRPSPELVSVAQLPGSYGFPSTTTVVAVVLGVLLVYLARRRDRSGPRRAIGPVVAAALVLIGSTSLSRIYAGEHWPSDILGSWLVGGCISLGLIALHAWWRRRSATQPLPTV